MHKTHFIYRVSIALFSIALISCDDTLPSPNGNLCEGLGPNASALDITDMQLKTGTPTQFYEDARYPLFNSLEIPYVSEETITFDSLVFSLEAITEDIYALQNRGKPFTFNLFNKAYACSLAIPSPQEKITNISITSANAFNDETPAGSSLTGYFDVIYASNSDDFYNRVNDKVSYLTLAEYLQITDVQASKSLQLRLNTEPEYLSNQKFFINVTLDSGENFMLETSEINFASPEEINTEG